MTTQEKAITAFADEKTKQLVCVPIDGFAAKHGISKLGYHDYVLHQGKLFLCVDWGKIDVVLERRDNRRTKEALEFYYKAHGLLPLFIVEESDKGEINIVDTREEMSEASIVGCTPAFVEWLKKNIDSYTGEVV